MSDHPDRGKWQKCPQCGSTDVEKKQAEKTMVYHVMCLKCNRSWEVPDRVISYDLPYEPK